MPSSDEYKNLKSEERRFIQRVAEHYAPRSLSTAQQARFDRTLEERLAASARSPFLRPAGILLPVCAAVLLWFALPYFKDRTPPAWDTAATEMSDRQDPTSHPTLLAYAYYQSEAQEDFLPAEYIALADAFELL